MAIGEADGGKRPVFRSTPAQLRPVGFQGAHHCAVGGIFFHRKIQQMGHQIATVLQFPGHARLHMHIVGPGLKWHAGHHHARGIHLQRPRLRAQLRNKCAAARQSLGRTNFAVLATHFVRKDDLAVPRHFHHPVTIGQQDPAIRKHKPVTAAPLVFPRHFPFFINDRRLLPQDEIGMPDHRRFRRPSLHRHQGTQNGRQKNRSSKHHKKLRVKK